MVKSMAADLMPPLKEALPNSGIFIVGREQCLTGGKECDSDFRIDPEQFFQVLQDMHQMAIIVTQRDPGLIPPAMKKGLERFGFRFPCQDARCVNPKQPGGKRCTAELKKIPARKVF